MRSAFDLSGAAIVVVHTAIVIIVVDTAVVIIVIDTTIVIVVDTAIGARFGPNVGSAIGLDE